MRQWSQANRAVDQVPILLAGRDAATDFDLAWCEIIAPLQETTAESATADDATAELWREHAGLAGRDVVRRDPLHWSEFEQELLRYEQLHTAGKGYAAAAAKSKTRAQQLQQELKGRPLPDLPLPHSLALGESASGHELLSPNDWDRLRGQLSNRELKQIPAGETPYAGRATAGWKWLLESADPARVQRALDFIGTSPEGADAIEVHFLRMLQAHLPASVWTQDEQHVLRLLQLRQSAEAAAAPPDERSWRAGQGAVERGDRARRGAEDNLFVGEPAALFALVSQAGEAATAFADAQKLEQRVAAAYRVRDQIWSELPSLALWMSRNHKYTGEAGDLRAQWEQIVLQAAQLASRLRELALNPEGIQSFTDDEWQQVDALFGRFRKLYGDECSRLQAEVGDDQMTLRDLEAVLAVPLISGNGRLTLIEKARRLAQELHAQYLQPVGAKSEANPSASGESPTADEKPVQRAWLPNPILTLLDPQVLDGKVTADERQQNSAADDAVRLSRLASDGESVRKLLQGVPPAVREMLATKLAGAELDEARRADSWARAAAPLLSDFSWVLRREQDPVHRLRLLNWQQIYVWHAARATDDFWNSATTGDAPYFQAVAGAYLRDAEQLYKGQEAERTAQIQRLKQRAQAAREGIRAVATPDTLVLTDKDSQPRQAVSAPASEHVPTGVAAVSVQGEDGNPIPLTIDGAAQSTLKQLRLGLPIGSEGELPRLEYDLEAGTLWDRGSRVDLVTLFRGHQSQMRVNVIRSEGDRTVVHLVPKPIPAPRISVFGTDRQETALTFIFDCSGSMSAPVAAAEGAGRTRFDVARQTLTAVLATLARSQSYSVAVRVYGHRVGWKGKFSNDLEDSKYGKAQRLKAKTRQERYDPHPSDDTELILEMGRFGPRELESVTEILNQLEPRGVTPLYLSIKEALADFQQSRAVERRIIVVTDGQNDQLPLRATGKLTTRQDVSAALRAAGRNIKLDIVGFQLGTDQELRTLASESSGNYYPARKADELLQALQRLLGLREFAVVALPGQAVIDGTKELGETVEVPWPGPRPQQYEVMLTDADKLRSGPLEIQGSEALELFLERGKLVHHRYEGTREQEIRDKIESITDPIDGGRREFIAAHLPHWEGNAVRFPISIQNAEAEQFSHRPAEVLVEITPVGADEQERFLPFVFWNADYEPSRPVPVIGPLAVNWPRGAARAEIRLWMRFTTTDPDIEVPLTEAAEHPERLKIESLPDMRFKVQVERGVGAQDPDQVVVSVENVRRNEELDVVKVELDPPASVTRIQYSKAGIVRHTFAFERKGTARLDDSRLQLTARRKLTEGALTLPRELKVRVPDALRN